MLEKEYYPIVANWLQKSYKCFMVKSDVGIENSRADVVGVKDIGGDFSGEIETIVIEVKRGKEAFATAAGQTYGYTIYANKVYLADIRTNGFSEDEIQIASHLGIGLIQITGTNRIKEVLSSPYHSPLTKFNIKFLHKLHLVKCQICQNHFDAGTDKNWYEKLAKENINKALTNGKGLVFWNRELNTRKEKFKIKPERRKSDVTYDRRFICNECVSTLFSIKNNN